MAPLSPNLNTNDLPNVLNVGISGFLEYQFNRSNQPKKIPIQKISLA